MFTRAAKMGLAVLLVLFALHLATTEERSASGQDDEIRTLGPPIGQLGGLTRSIVELPGEKRLLLGNGPRLALVDIEEPMAPRLIGRGPMLDGLVESIVVLDRQILVQAGETIYSLALAAPLGATLGSQRFQLEYDRRGKTINAFGAWHDRAFVVEGGNIRQFEVGDVGLFQPLPSIQVPEGFEAVDLLAAGGRLYLSTVETMDDFIERPVRRLMVYDIAGDSVPRLLGQHEHSGWGRLAVASPPGPQATVFGIAEGVIGMDLRAVDRPDMVFVDDSSSFRGSEPWHLVVDRSGTPIVMHGWYGAILHPPSERGGRWETRAMLGNTVGGGMAVAEQFVYASAWHGPLHVASMGADPGAAVMDMLGEVSSLDVSEERPDLLVSMSSQGGISTVSVSDVSRLRRLATRYFGETRFAGMRSSGDLIVASDTGGSDTFLEGRSILDIGDDAQLEQKHWHLLGANFESLAAILVRGHRYWITSSMGEVQEHEIDGNDTTQLRQIEATGLVRDLALAPDERTLFVLRIDNAEWNAPARPILDIFDIGQPGQAILRRSFDLGPRQGEWSSQDLLLAVDGRFAYVIMPELVEGERLSHLHVYDLNSTDLALLSSFNLGRGGRDFRVSRGYGFLSMHDSLTMFDTLVMDLRDPTEPSIHGWIRQSPGYRYPGWGYDRIAVEGNRVYLAAGAMGIEVYEPDLDWTDAPPYHTPLPSASPTASPETVTATPTEQPIHYIWLPCLSK